MMDDVEIPPVEIRQIRGVGEDGKHSFLHIDVSQRDPARPNGRTHRAASAAPGSGRQLIIRKPHALHMKVLEALVAPQDREVLDTSFAEFALVLSLLVHGQCLQPEVLEHVRVLLHHKPGRQQQTSLP